MSRVSRKAATSTDNAGVVSFSAGDYWYHSHTHADFQISHELAKTRPVLIVNSMGMRMPSLGNADGWMRVRRKLKSISHVVKHPQPNLTVLSPIFLPVYGTGFFARMNSVFVTAQVRMVMSRFGPFRYRIVANPTAWRTAQHVGDGPIVLYRVDHFSATEDVDTSKISELEDIAFLEADATLYSSGALMRREPDRHHGKGRLFEHGVDLSLFDPDAAPVEPADLRSIGHPRVVMMGSLEKTDRIEQTLAIAAQVPEAQFVIIGGGVKTVPKSTLPNVHFLGQKQPSELPAYLAHVDVGLVVVARSEWGAAASPIKLKEYLAMGLPVVSTWFDDVELFGDHIRYATSNEDVARELRHTLADHGPSTRSERLARVASEGWDAKAAEFMRILQQLDADATALG